MLPNPTLPASLVCLLAAFESCFTAPTFRTFCALMAGLVAQTGPRTVCGMLVGAGLSRAWAHDRAHRFFSAARWSPERVGLVLARLVVSLLVPAGTAVTVVIDDTLFRRRGRKVWAVSWFHDGSVQGPHKVGFGNNWVIAGIVVTLPFVSRPVCLPVLAALVVKDTTSASRLWLARRMVTALATAVPERSIEVVADAAYAGRELRVLPDRVSWTTRLRKDAALHEPAPPRTGLRGRPRVKGNRLGSLSALAAALEFTPTTVCRYGTTTTVQVATLTCLWYSVFGSRRVQVVLVREAGTRRGYDLALVSTDLQAGPSQIIERYAARWSVEVAIEDAKQLFGVGQARNRLAPAVRRSVPFALVCQTLTMLWYATAGHHPDDVTAHRERAPWYASKAQPSTADMIAKLHRVLIAARFRPSRPDEPTPAEIHTIRLAWDNHAA
ncbi:MAG: transposase [Acidobacteria bacterium]|nr:transposase [Acidobacteriota bacterium]